jgi:hypothetical protein
MGQKYCRPEPCYHGHGYQPPLKRRCSCRSRLSLLMIPRRSRCDFGSQYYRPKYRRY